MSDVSTGVTGREWLTVVFFFSPQCYEDQRGFFVDYIAMEGEDMLSDGERFSDWKTSLEENVFWRDVRKKWEWDDEEGHHRLAANYEQPLQFATMFL